MARAWYRTYRAIQRLQLSVRNSRASPCQVLCCLLIFSACVYLVSLPISLLSSKSRGNAWKVARILRPGEDAFTYFAGRDECGISQSQLHTPPSNTEIDSLPFCKNRFRLLTALSAGGRPTFTAPFVGKDCTYQWFNTEEICMILSRFQGIVFLGDGPAQGIYTAFNILLREDLAQGGLNLINMSEEDEKNCNCDGQFIKEDCMEYFVNGSEDLTKGSEMVGAMGSLNRCKDTPHHFIPVYRTPAPPRAIQLFKNLTYSKPQPWQPIPVVFSYNPSSYFAAPDITLLSTAAPKAEDALEEWLTLARGAERNIPVLYLSPPAVPSRSEGFKRTLWNFHESVVRMSREKHFEVMGLWSVTFATRFGEGLALVEAMMVINWLAMVETS